MKRLMILGLILGFMPMVAVAGAPTPEPKASQREWMRAHGQAPGRWMARHLDCTLDRVAKLSDGTPNPNYGQCVQVTCTTSSGASSDCSGTGKYGPESDVKLTRTNMKPYEYRKDTSTLDPNDYILDSNGLPKAFLSAGYQGADSTDPTKVNGTDCQSSCHYLPVEAGRSNHEVDGFTNAFAVTSHYSGPIDPGMLLTNPENQTAHATAFRAETVYEPGTAPDPNDPTKSVNILKVIGRPGGCAACHSPEARDWKGVEAVEGCRSCHNFKIFDAESQVNEGPSMHATHAVLLEALKAVGDVDSPATKPSCDYCHVQTAQGGVAACWNCHLSGHWPKAPYFAEFDTGDQTPALPELP